MREVSGFIKDWSVVSTPRMDAIFFSFLTYGTYEITRSNDNLFAESYRRLQLISVSLKMLIVILLRNSAAL